MPHSYPIIDEAQIRQKIQALRLRYQAHSLTGNPPKTSLIEIDEQYPAPIINIIDREDQQPTPVLKPYDGKEVKKDDQDFLAICAELEAKEAAFSNDDYISLANALSTSTKSALQKYGYWQDVLWEIDYRRSNPIRWRLALLFPDKIACIVTVLTAIGLASVIILAPIGGLCLTAATVFLGGGLIGYLLYPLIKERLTEAAKISEQDEIKFERATKQTDEWMNIIKEIDELACDVARMQCLNKYNKVSNFIDAQERFSASLSSQAQPRQNELAIFRTFVEETQALIHKPALNKDALDSITTLLGHTQQAYHALSTGAANWELPVRACIRHISKMERKFNSIQREISSAKESLNVSLVTSLAALVVVTAITGFAFALTNPLVTGFVVASGIALLFATCWFGTKYIVHAQREAMEARTQLNRNPLSHLKVDTFKEKISEFFAPSVSAANARGSDDKGLREVALIIKEGYLFDHENNSRLRISLPSNK